jgi:hypothetical protein
MNRKFYAAESRKDLTVVLRRKMIGFEIQQKFFARHTQHAVTLQAIFAAV